MHIYPNFTVILYHHFTSRNKKKSNRIQKRKEVKENLLQWRILKALEKS